MFSVTSRSALVTWNEWCDRSLADGAHRLRHVLPLVLLLAMCLGTSGCSLWRVNVDAQTYGSTAVVTGRVLWRGGGALPAPFTVFLRSLPIGGPTYALPVGPSGYFEFIVPRGSYRAVAVSSISTMGAKASVCESQDASFDSTFNERWIVAEIELHVSEQSCESGREWDVSPTDVIPGDAAEPGRVIDIDAPAMSRERAEAGYWEPMRLLRTDGAKLWFLEPADRRIPIVFVHGAAGSPQDWRRLIDRVDRSRFQVWLFVYPSGMPLEAAASLLRQQLMSMVAVHRVPALSIVAHSMGGLVARASLVGGSVEWPCRVEFMSLATPWGGDRWAESGVNHLSISIPSWRNMQSGGPFLRWLLARSLPKNVRHDLFFGFRRPVVSMRTGSSDGVIDVSSAIPIAVQVHASSQMGFDEDHMSILQSDAVIAQWQAVLDRFARHEEPPSK